MRLTEPWLILFAAATIILLIAGLSKEAPRSLLCLVAAAGFAAAFVESWRLWLSGETLASGMLRLDRLSFVGWLLCFLAGLLTVLMSHRYLQLRREAHPEYYALILLSAIGQACLIAAGDLVTLFVGLETMSVAVYALAGFFRRRPEGNEAALKYFLTGAFASAFLIMGIAFLFGSTGTTDLAAIAAHAANAVANGERTFFLFGVACVVIGLGFKVAAVPFHAWVPDVYDGAPTPITAFMATAVKAAAFFAFARVAVTVVQHVGVVWDHLFCWLAVATMLVGNVAAIVQNNLKRMLAYSSIAHAGYLFVAFPAIGGRADAAIAAIGFYLFAYVMMTIGAFAGVAVCQGGTEDAHVDDLAGLGRRHPWLAAMLTLFLISLTGFPPTIGFFAKYYLFLGAVKAGFMWLVVAALLNSAISAYYYLRPIVVMYFREPRAETTADEAATLPTIAVLTLAAVVVIVFGLFPGNLLTIVTHSIF